MLNVSELTGALLDYYVARAKGIPAEQLTIRRVQRSESCHVVRCWTASDLAPVHVVVLAYSTDWAHGGPLIEKHKAELAADEDGGWHSGWGWVGYYGEEDWEHCGYGDTPLQAICRAVVRAAFGDEVDDVPVQQ